MSERSVDTVDSVYLLLFPGWETSMRGNRWHWAKRWAASRPTTIVEPDGASGVTTDPRIPGLRLLHVTAKDDASIGEAGLRQAAAIAEDIRRNRFTRPLLWSYNPHLAIAFGAVPAAARVFHATENYFAYSGLEPEFVPRFRASLDTADLVVAVSEGVARRISSETGTPTTVITNGVDCADYGGAVADAALREAAAGFQRVAIYAGNVNSRLDFELLHECVHRFEDTLFAFYGRTWFPRKEDEAVWENIVAHHNASFFGEVDPDRLPALYAAADVGLIPYTHDPLLVENGFPLKALEMAATGLPVVSSLMEPIVGLADGIVVADDRPSFLAALAETSRRTLTGVAAAELAAVCAANDYDVKFRDALAAIAAHVTGGPPAVRLDAAAALDPDGWLRGLADTAHRQPTASERARPAARRLARHLRPRSSR